MSSPKTLCILIVVCVAFVLIVGGGIGVGVALSRRSKPTESHSYNSPPPKSPYRSHPVPPPPPQNPFKSLDANRRKLESQATILGGPITWPEFNSDQAANAGRRVMLQQSDFADGTLLVKESAVLVLTEDIQFNPRPAADWRPEPALVAEEPGFLLGFFAAIALAGDDIVLDLAGFTLEQHKEHLMQQRFYSNVELANAPFIDGTGPAAFGSKFRAARRVCIMNGHLGMSSHHEVHGNGGEGIMIYNVTMLGYEVASFHCNACADVSVKKVKALGNNHDIPITGTYSQSRLLMPFLAGAIAANPGNLPLKTARDELKMVMDQAFQDVMGSGVVNPAHAVAHKLFHNTKGLLDGNCYGMAVHQSGPAVINFADEPENENAGHSRNIWFEEVEIRGTYTGVQEVVALADSAGKTLKGPAGDILRVLDISDDQGNYVANPLANAKIMLAEATPHPLGTLHVPLVARQWAHGQLTLAQLIQQHNYSYIRNGDTMFHVCKGSVGLRIDGSHGVHILDVVVDDIQNFGDGGDHTPHVGETGDVIYYHGADDGGHPEQGDQRGFMGADVRGFSVSGATEVTVNGLAVTNIKCQYGWAHGIDVFNSATKVRFSRTTIDGVRSEHVAEHGFRATRAIGLRVTENAEDVTWSQLDVQNVECPTIGGTADILTSDEEPHTHVEHSKNVFEL